MRPPLPDGLTVEYRHEATMSKRPPKGETECVETMLTTATLYNQEGGPVAWGSATLNPRDSFSVALAHNISLGRALAEYDGTSQRRKAKAETKAAAAALGVAA